jgi:hypothetical protein
MLSRRVKRIVRRAYGFIPHPLPVTCLDCGFLELAGQEVTPAERIMLATPSSAVQPDWKKVWCHRNLWHGYELGYVGPAYEALEDELKKVRRDCEGFFRHRPGWSPAGHLELLLKAHEKRSNLFFLLLGSILTLLFTWLAKRLGLN